jgi:hypothetical protein
LKVKKGYPWSDQVGIIVGALCEEDGDEGAGENGTGKGLVVWTVEVSDLAIEFESFYLGHLPWTFFSLLQCVYIPTKLTMITGFPRS